MEVKEENGERNMRRECRGGKERGDMRGSMKRLGGKKQTERRA